ncbi:MAG: ferredoxin [Proteobacteria bacterium]|nr:ferredoxin [Pseudomonadota bacterium]
MKKPFVDLSECTLCGICTELWPKVFGMNDAGFVEIADMEHYPEDRIRDVIKHCPADCIHCEEI